MTDDRPLVLLTEPLHPEAARWLDERCRTDTARDDDELRRKMTRASGLIARTGTRVDESLLAIAPHLRVVGRAGVGLDHIDVEACRARGIEVVWTPDASTQAVVEYVFLLMTRALRPIAELREAVDASTWRRLRTETVGRRQLDELTIGILGLGRIGRGVARVARAVGSEVLFHDLLEVPPADRNDARPAGLEELFERSDVLSIHVDGRASNDRFVDATLLSRLPDDAVLINTSRGFVVDNVALASWLRARPETQAHLDVHPDEPFPADSPLVSLPNAHLYPHLASRTERALRDMSWVVKDVARCLGIDA